MRKLAQIAVLVLLPSALLISLGSSASAVITYTGTATCTSAGGTITFTPPLLSNGNSLTETIKVTNPIKPCTPSSPNVPPTIHGVITGKVVISTASAPDNNCGVLFPSSPGTKPFGPTPSPSAWKVVWNPAGTPSHLSFTTFNVINTAGQISFGVPMNPITGSFKSPPPGGVVLSGGATWSLAAIQAACALPTGLKHLTIGTTGVDAL